MCRLLLVVDDSEQKLLPLVSARRQNKRGQLFGLSKGERLHGFGVAWLTGRAAGAVVTTRPPSDDLNVRRVLGATSSRLALAFIRSCACDRCPATTYCPASDANAQPFVRGGASGLVVAHVGILHHHRELLRDGGEAGRRAAAVADCGDAGNSDAAFLYRLVASYYDDFGGDLERAVRATLDLVSATGPPSSLNLVATDKTGRVVACRRRSPGDGQAPPPLFYASTATGALRPLEGTAALWRAWGLRLGDETSATRLLFYCGSGWRSSVAWCLAQLMGHTDCANFDGGFLEWAVLDEKAAERPIAMGAPSGVREFSCEASKPIQRPIVARCES